jgi:primosomal protein N' (replication factor Y) (superfamily II helicase)
MIAHVSLAIPVSKTFSYSVPRQFELFIKPYMRVKVPFRNRVLTGYVVGVDNGSDDALKEILGVVDIFPLFNESLASLSLWASHYYATPLGLILKYAVPLNLQVEQYLLVKSLCDSTSSLNGISLKKVLRSAGRDTVLNLYHKREIAFYDVFTGKAFTSLVQEPGRIQKHDKILYLGSIDDRMEHYLMLISRHIAGGGNVLMLLPDYHASGRYFYKVLAEKFKCNVSWYGSPGKAKARMEIYFKARSDGGFIILGNKSAAFLPLLNNGLIIVERSEGDEYRNEEGVRFNAWMIALKRAEIENIPIVFGSAAPPLEIYKGVGEGFRIIDKSVSIKREDIHIVMKKNLSTPGKLPGEFTGVVGDAIAKGKNVAIFTPRKDYVSHLFCLECKTPFLCTICGRPLSYQKRSNVLICSTCGKSINYEEKCMHCSSELIRFSQTGAEYMEGKLKDAFAQCPIVKVTGETLEEVVKGAMLDESVKPLNPTIFIGTQALSKLYAADVKLLILYGWEELLRISGYRANEKMYQVLMNLVDALRPERIYFFMDEKRSVELAPFIDVRSFYRNELQKRRLAEYPPYVRLFLVEVEKKNREMGQRLVKKIQIFLEREGFGQYMTGPLVQKKRYRYQYKMILKIPENEFISQGLLALYNFSGVRIEPDPPSI